MDFCCVKRFIEVRFDLFVPHPLPRLLRIGCVLHARIALPRLLTRRFAELLPPFLLFVFRQTRMIAHSQSLRLTPLLHPHIQLHSQRPQVSLLRERQASPFDVRQHGQRLVHVPHAAQRQNHFAVRLRRRHQPLQLHIAKQLRGVDHMFRLGVHRYEEVIRHAIGFLSIALRSQKQEQRVPRWIGTRI